jgi:transcriptional regulator with AAA-type ATPase domain/tetratricopeptide (TPR) repeat protein
VPSLPDLLGESDVLVALRQAVERLLERQRASRHLPPVLIVGETGTGKGLLARAFHQAGPRASAPFIDVNCAAIPVTLIESELFGYERGAFTDARRAKPGLFQAAHGGTLFLDEIGLLPEACQAKILKVLEDRAVRRLGSTRTEPVDVGIITATNEDLAVAVRERRFRADLYHRLAVVTFTMPPLRERGNDVVLLAEHLLARACREHDIPPKGFTDAARAALQAYRWPGNVRELANVVERIVLLTDAARIDAADLGLGDRAAAQPATSVTTVGGEQGLGDILTDVERTHLRRALDQTGGNLAQTAAALRIPRNTLRYRLRRLGLGWAVTAGTGGAAREPARAEPVSGRRPPAPPANSATEPAVPRVAFDERAVVALAVTMTVTGHPDPVVERSRALALLFERVRLFGGRLDRVRPEGCVAFFGLDPVEDAARRAAGAALAMHRSLERRLSEEAPEHDVRIALDVATVPLVLLGETWEIELARKQQVFDALDDLLTVAAPGDIVAGESATPFLERRFELAASASRTHGGRTIVHLSGAERSGYERRGRMTRFVGRQPELDRLDALLGAAGAGRGQVVALVGEPGSGKSRLLLEHRRSAVLGRERWIDMTCLSHAAATPFYPVIGLLRRYLGIGEDDPGDVVTRALATAPAVAEDETLLPPLLQFLGRLPPTHPFSLLPPADRRRRSIDAVVRLLVAECRVTPVILAVEDLQWIDRETQAVLRSLALVTPVTRLLVIVTHRTDYDRTWLGSSSVAEISLAPLSEGSSREMLDDLLGPDPSLDPLKQVIAARTEGNPFHLEESVWALVESQVVSGHAGAYRFRGAGVDPAMPATVQAALNARIANLSDARRRLLQCAAVIGRTVPLALLERAVAATTDAVRAEIVALRAAAFFKNAPGGADDPCEFRHALTHEVVYEGVPVLERKVLHRTVLHAMEEGGPEHVVEHAERLADHAVRGEVWDRAIDHLRCAGAKAFQRAAPLDAIARYEEALAITSRLPASADTARRVIDVRLDLHAPLQTVGEIARLAALYPEAERLARELGDGLRLGQVLQRLSQVAWLGGRYRIGAEYAKQAHAVAGMSSDAVTLLHAGYFLGLHQLALGEYAGAIPCFERIVAGPNAGIAPHLIAVTLPMDVAAWVWLTYPHMMRGEFTPAAAAIRRAVDRAESSGVPQARAMAATLQALMLLYRGRAAEAREPAERAAELTERIGFVIWLPGAYATVGLARSRLGQPEQAMELFARGMAINEKAGVRALLSQRYGWWAEACLHARRLDEAQAHVETSLDMARTMEERGVEAEALLVRARLARARKEPATHAAFERAIAAAAALGARPLQAHGHRALGAWLQAVGRAEEARAQFDTAAAMLQEMSMAPWWAERFD